MWQKGDRITWFFALSFMKPHHRLYFDERDMTITNQLEADMMNKEYPKGKMIPK